MLIEAFIFDFDGVLCDSSLAHKTSLINALKSCGYSWNNDFEVTYEKVKNKKTIVKLSEFCNLQLIHNSDIFKIEKLKQSLTIKEISTLKIQQNVPKLLRLIKLKNKKISIASDAASATIIEFLESNNCLNLFDLIVTSEMVNKKMKPFPDVYQEVIKRMNVNPNNSIVFEDTVDGINAAMAAGISNIRHCTYNNLHNILNIVYKGLL